MRWRILEIGGAPRYISLERGLIQISDKDQMLGRLDIDGILSLLVRSPGATISTPVIDKCAQNNIPIIFCNQRFLPTSIAVPLDFHSDQTRRIRTQINVKTSVKNQIWKQIVKAKIKNQCEVLRYFNLTGVERLNRLSQLVKAGDTQNHEAQAAQLYWPALFGPKFRRNRSAEDQNILLNYGYIIMRSAMLSAILSVGLHPTISVHHKNRSNPFCLVDDLMEPYRPIIDQIVKRLHEKSIVTLNQNVKMSLASVVANDRNYGDGMAAHFQNMVQFVQNYLLILESGKGQVMVPKLFTEIELESLLTEC